MIKDCERGCLRNFERHQSCSDNLEMEQDPGRRNSEEEAGQTCLFMKQAGGVEVGGDLCKLSCPLSWLIQNPIYRATTEGEGTSYN